VTAGAEAPSPAASSLVGFKGTVTYKNGRPAEPFEGGPALYAAWELYALRNGYELRGDRMPGYLMAMVVAFEALGHTEGFETWRRDVYGVELEAVPVPPTPPALSAA
jgi:hypothetical protein